MSDREAMKLALKALDTLVSPVGSIYAQARKALRAALAAPRPEIQVMVDPAALTAAAAYVPVRIVTPDDAEIAQAAKFEKAYQNNRAAPPAAAPRPEPEHPGYVIGNGWLEKAYERIRAGEAEADVLRDYGLWRCANGIGPAIDAAMQEDKT